MPPALDRRLILDRERRACTNAWAFLRCLNAAEPAAPASWAALTAAVAADPAAARALFGALARIPDLPAPLPLPSGTALARRRETVWDPARLFACRAALLLHLDLRPDDVVLLVGIPASPWLPALMDGTRLIVAAAEDIPPLAAATGATIVAASPARLAAAAARRPARADLPALRGAIAVGGPLTRAAHADVGAWIKPDLMRLAWAGARFWGTPLDPLDAEPAPLPHLFAAG